ncbi:MULTISPECIES: HD domain-containing protein [unclassified Bacillus (in: firmicutes)]|uniref:HD domain-containing protein n=1 Tax=unclassified Bacillus (in: firmicutes) TaxID=185979 RepID=UPI00040072DD|nr:HD domain-containing protein [Bacillus sp. NSP9.1]QHZ47350.1 HD domain-containing protein [Bacillus sp. NSP9.1]
MAGMNQQKRKQISQMSKWVKEKLAGEGTGHDWLHIKRVRSVSLAIAKEEGADLFITEAAALLHDVIDVKLSDEHRVSLEELYSRFVDWNVEEKAAAAIIGIITKISFRDREKYKDVKLSKEGMSVQDADRLDAIGAVGIARAFMYAGAKGHMLYSDGTPEHDIPSALKHFDEKLLHLKDLMNTKTGWMLAKQRHEVMLAFLKELKNECAAFSQTALIDRERGLW